MFHGLEAGNGPIELFALFGVFNGLVEHVLSGAQVSAANANRANVYAAAKTSGSVLTVCATTLS